MCHCLDCQRRTGSAFSVAMFYERGNVRVVGPEPASFERLSASGQPVTFRFCPTCGSNVYWEPHRMPALIGVALDAFADPTIPPPEQAVWTKDKHPWFSLPESIVQFETTPLPAGPPQS